MISGEKEIKEVFDEATQTAIENIIELRRMFPSATIEAIALHVTILTINGMDDHDNINFDGTYQFNLITYRLAESAMYMDSMETRQ